MRGLVGGAVAGAAAVLLWAGAAGAAEDWRTVQARQIAIVHQAVEKYRDVEVARADGWKFRGAVAPLMGEHWSRKDQPVPVAGEPLDFSKPANLMYSNIGGQMRPSASPWPIPMGATRN